ncbi:hypothetical protein [Chryseobacterium sp. MP_3.2]|uniref:hypothetical protein n=1 Tax=Chryseobacterium sp. MP_3.2 TaxID=3071712 RepID=UPI002DFB6B7D|nr:hypothetical protein [Chryseobacterium sp. MP_3.2]
MKKWLSYLLLLTYFTSFSEVRQIVKMPSLIEHFISHKIGNSDMSLYAFFKMHYIDDQIVDSDYNQDMNLPFKTLDFSNSALTLNIPPEKGIIMGKRNLVYVDFSNKFSYSEKFYTSVYQNIWEPPKI